VPTIAICDRHTDKLIDRAPLGERAMTAMYLQTALLLMLAYFVGAATACLIRRTLFGEVARERERRISASEENLTAAIPRRVEATPRTDAARFERPMAGEDRNLPPAAPMTARPAPIPAVQPRREKAQAVAPPVSKIDQTVAPAPAADDLTRIRFIDNALQTGLNKLGILRYEQVAAWMKADVLRMNQVFGFKGRIEQENWIEQAQILAKQGETFYARRLARGDAVTGRPSSNEGEQRALPAASPSPVAAKSPFAGVSGATPVSLAAKLPTAREPASQPVREAQPPGAQSATASAGVAATSVAKAATTPSAEAPIIVSGRDNLQRISGISAEIERLLNNEGVVRYAQITSWSRSDVDRFDRLLGNSGRIARENWIEQAGILAGGGETAFSRSFNLSTGSLGADVTAAPAVERSMQDESPDGARDRSAVRPERIGQQLSERIRRSSEADDLKRIRGIGVLIEKKLNSMKITSYDQIANWSRADVERVSQVLDFKGRIERENWIEQARILASGGQTEFARRVDRGELESSKYKPG
jgi:predicted flap endonuclease-1-like 5' DNA nuclease